MSNSFLFLGTGASTGVPVIGCKCQVCHSGSLKNRRLRSSSLVKIKDKTLLIDVGPDFRQQALETSINRLDGVLLSHPHYDHIGGLDDLRILYFMQKKPIPCLLSKESYFELKQRFEHLFRQPSKDGSLTTQLDFMLLEKDEGKVQFQTIDIGYFSYFQGGSKVLGFRIGDLAYITDIKDFDEKIFQNLKNVNTLIISALRDSPSPVQFNFEEAISFSNEVKAKKTYLTHLAHEVDFDFEQKRLPADIFLAYDGLEIFFNYP